MSKKKKKTQALPQPVPEAASMTGYTGLMPIPAYGETERESYDDIYPNRPNQPVNNI